MDSDSRLSLFFVIPVVAVISFSMPLLDYVLQGGDLIGTPAEARAERSTPSDAETLERKDTTERRHSAPSTRSISYASSAPPSPEPLATSSPESEEAESPSHESAEVSEIVEEAVEEQTPGEAPAPPEDAPAETKVETPATTPPYTPSPKEAQPKPPVSTSPLQGADKEMLLLHNDARAALDIPALVWSEELASGAEDWADELADNSCEIEHSDPNAQGARAGEPYGENIFTLWSSDDSMQSEPKDAFSWWFKEKKYYDYNTGECDDGEVCGHYTQIVWSTTTALGCAKSRCEADPTAQNARTNGAADIWVCQYSPPGNSTGTLPY